MDSVMNGLMGQRPPPGIFGLEPPLPVNSKRNCFVVHAMIYNRMFVIV